jgi:hypothetical protein
MIFVEILENIYKIKGGKVHNSQSMGKRRSIRCCKFGWSLLYFSAMGKQKTHLIGRRLFWTFLEAREMRGERACQEISTK